MCAPSSQKNTEDAKNKKTYNSWDSPVVTHLTTSQPVRCLSKAERTGSPVLIVLWSYVEELDVVASYIFQNLRVPVGHQGPKWCRLNKDRYARSLQGTIGFEKSAY